MPVILDVQPQLKKLDEQIINLLATRHSLCTDLRGINELDAETLELWLDKAAEQGLDEATMERICKLVLILSRREEE